MPPPGAGMSTSSAELLARPVDIPGTYDSAIDRNENVLNKMAWEAKRKALYTRLWEQRLAIDAITRHHLGVPALASRDRCTVEASDKWLRGGFNVCIPVRCGSSGHADQQSVLFRCPLPYKFGEDHCPGTADEKLSCEVGAYIWMQENCPDIRIPHLYGFGFSDGRQFTHASHCPWYIYAIRSCKRALCRLLGWPVPSLYVPRNTGILFSSNYMLLERIAPEVGRMLAFTWDEEHMHDQARRQRLFSGISRIILSLSRTPQPRIGAFRFHDDGTISLTNRPYTTTLALLENDGAPRVLQRDATYACTEPYVSDLLTFHDRAFTHNPNATFNEMDCQISLAAKVTLRALTHHCVRRESREGPFVLQHTDLSLGNIFVDDDWNVTAVIDLEWICALPVEELAVPYWLTNRPIDGLDGEHLAEFDKTRHEFMLAFEKEEQKTTALHDMRLAEIMQETWASGRMWFWLALSSINAATPLVYRHIVPRYTKKFMRFREAMHEFWCQGATQVVEAKLADFKSYDAQLREAYKVPEPANT